MKARIDEFLIDIKPQKEWGWAVITYLFLGGAGAGLFLVSLYMRHAWGEGLGLLVLVLGTLFLLIDLGRPERFWRAFFRAADFLDQPRLFLHNSARNSWRSGDRVANFCRWNSTLFTRRSDSLRRSLLLPSWSIPASSCHRRPRFRFGTRRFFR